jgi:hypothetical protein
MARALAQAPAGAGGDGGAPQAHFRRTWHSRPPRRCQRFLHAPVARQLLLGRARTTGSTLKEPQWKRRWQPGPQPSSEARDDAGRVRARDRGDGLHGQPLGTRTPSRASSRGRRFRTSRASAGSRTTSHSAARSRTAFGRSEVCLRLRHTRTTSASATGRRRPPRGSAMAPGPAGSAPAFSAARSACPRAPSDVAPAPPPHAARRRRRAPPAHRRSGTSASPHLRGRAADVGRAPTAVPPLRDAPPAFFSDAGNGRVRHAGLAAPACPLRHG